MRTHELVLGELNSPNEVLSVLKEKQVEEGDTVKLFTDEETGLALMATIFLVLIVVAAYFRNKLKRQKEGGQILEDLFRGKPVEELEKEIEEEYGINIEIEHRRDEERMFWHQATVQAMAKEYGDDEPDYSDVPLMEPNLSYRPWNKQQ